LICTRNGSQRLIGKNVLIKNIKDPMTFGAFMSVFRSENNNFVVHLFKTDNYIEQVQMNLGARINQITTKNLNGFKFKFPVLQEQIKIANFLTSIDEKITEAQTYLNTVKQYKQGLLQQMFI
jgi:type I restriction enzyme S subunit